jgi:RNA polymerase sigma factor for flagellar operon FliA
MTAAAGFTQEPRVLSESRRAEMIMENLPRVRWIAAHIHQRLPATIVMEDLISIGVIGLIEALDRYDPSLGVQFKTYAEHRIRGAILDSVSELDGIPAHKRAKARSFKQAVSAVEQRLGRTPTSEEVAGELGVSLKGYHEWINDIRGVSVGSLATVYVTDNGEFSLADMIADQGGIPAEDLIEDAERTQLIERGVEVLPPLERAVVRMYFHDGLCLREIAAQLSLHITRVSQLKSRATQRLRRFVEARWSLRNGGAVA